VDDAAHNLFWLRNIIGEALGALASLLNQITEPPLFHKGFGRLAMPHDEMTQCEQKKEFRTADGGSEWRWVAVPASRITGCTERAASLHSLPWGSEVTQAAGQPRAAGSRRALTQACAAARSMHRLFERPHQLGERPFARACSEC